MKPEEKRDVITSLAWDATHAHETRISTGPKATAHLFPVTASEEHVVATDVNEWDLDGYNITMHPLDFVIEQTEVNCQLSSTFQRFTKDHLMFIEWFQVISWPMAIYAAPEYKEPLHDQIHRTQSSIFFLLHDNPKLFIKGHQNIDLKVVLESLAGTCVNLTPV